MLEPGQEKFLYPTSTDVMQGLEKLTGDPVVDDKLPEGQSKAGVLAGIESSSSRILCGLRNARPASMS